MSKPELYQRVVVNRDLPDEQLRKCDVAWLVDYVVNRSGEEGAILEVFNALGESILVLTLPSTAIEPLRANQIPAVRELETPLK